MKDTLIKVSAGLVAGGAIVAGILTSKPTPEPVKTPTVETKVTVEGNCTITETPTTKEKICKH